MGGRLLGSFARPAKVIPSRATAGGAMRAQEALVPMGATLTPGQLTKSKTIGLAETLGNYGLLSGGRLQGVRDTAHGVGQQLLRAHLDDLPERGGDVIRNAYLDLGKRGRGVMVDLLEPMQDALILAHEHQGRIPQIDKIGKWITDLAAKTPDGRVGFATAARLRSDLLGIERRAEGVLNPQALHGAAEKLAGSVDRAMERAIPTTQPELYAAWRGTNMLVKKSVFRDVAEDMVVKATKDGKINGTVLAHQLERMGRIQRSKLDPTSLKDFTEFVNVIRQTESKSTTETGRMWIQLMQASAAVGLVSGGAVEPKNMGILGVPYVVSLALTNPKSARYLIQGIRGAGTPAAEAAFKRMVAVMAGQGMAGTQEPTTKPYKQPWER